MRCLPNNFQKKTIFNCPDTKFSALSKTNRKQIARHFPKSVKSKQTNAFIVFNVQYESGDKEGTSHFYFD